MHELLLASLRAVAVAAIVAGTAGAGPPQDAFEPMTPALRSRLDTALTATKGMTPGLSVAVVEDGRLVYAGGFGFADVAAKTPVTPETRFHIGSVTKMFTAVSVMQLVERGSVGLDDALARYLPSAPHANEVTIRELLTHTSGIWNYADDAVNSGADAAPTTPQAIVASVAARPLGEKPGAAFAYSNTGYVLLGLVVEAVTHEPLARYEQEHIFAPVGMASTTAGEPRAGVSVAQGYADAKGTPAARFDDSWFYADGDIVSTASDVARFDIALMSGSLVAERTFALMQSAAVPAAQLGAHARYGLGLSVVQVPGDAFVGHHGGMPGFEAENEMLPARGFAMIVLSNAFSFPTASANNTILALTDPSLYAAIVASVPSPPPHATADVAGVSAKLRAFLAGLQRGEIDRTTATDAVNAALNADALAALKGQLAALGALQTLTSVDLTTSGPFQVYKFSATFSSGQTLPLTFTLDAAGRVAGFVFQ